eukprot:5290044-Alexandrium_andersonii.AAC.1
MGAPSERPCPRMSHMSVVLHVGPPKNSCEAMVPCSSSATSSSSAESSTTSHAGSPGKEARARHRATAAA